MKLHRADAIKIKELSEKHGLTIKEVEEITISPYSFIRVKTREIDFDDNMTKEQFEEMEKNFNIPCLGKLNASYFMYNQIQKKKNNKK
jgi:hypothetical protein